MAETFVPAREVLEGVELVPLPLGVTVLDAIVAIKVLDEEGSVAWYTRVSRGVSSVESLGALRFLTVLEERDMMAGWTRATDEGGD